MEFMRAYIQDRVTEWKAWGDLTEDLDTETAVNAMLSAYERSTTEVGYRLPIPVWCERFYKVMMEQDQQVRFSYLRGVRAKTARH